MGNCVNGDQGSKRNGIPGGSSNPSNTIKKVPKLPHNSDQHKLNDLKPIIKPSLPNQLVTPTTNPHLKDKIKVIPSENLAVKVLNVTLRSPRMSSIGLSSNGLCSLNSQFQHKYSKNPAASFALEVSKKNTNGSVRIYNTSAFTLPKVNQTS